VDAGSFIRNMKLEADSSESIGYSPDCPAKQLAFADMELGRLVNENHVFKNWL